MCIVFYTLSQPGYKLILASNRDEYLDRPASPAHWHRFGFDTAATAAAAATTSSTATAYPHANDREDGDAEDFVSSRNPADGTDRKDRARARSEPSEPWVLSGRDMGSVEQGTWLGMTRDLRIGVLTNIRQSRSSRSSAPSFGDRPSRGTLLRSFLAPPPSLSLPSVDTFLRDLLPSAEDYDGFNLLLFHLRPPPSSDSNGTSASPFEHPCAADWDHPQVGYLSNCPAPICYALHPPTPDTAPRLGPNDDEELGKAYGMSNSPLAEPWTKVTEGEKAMAQSLEYWYANGEDEERLIERLMKLLQPHRKRQALSTRANPQSQSIPLTSLASATASTLIPPLQLGSDVESPLDPSRAGRWYGTRLSTIILVRDDGHVTLVERDVARLEEGQVRTGTGGERRFGFRAAPPVR